ncbi:E3 SUMO-protein ligase RanBP2-like isoform X4 [Gallus gallus]|uniref:E3 SUMO-protein ligase RanBP2-like isoform X4 n=1 Tax=Gallus gallus TaxID=9031 RepID=UPI001AE5D676|nr:E3 SUMO-protein ligase RanBP2-like isoform X4 [Gallus gallus]
MPARETVALQVSLLPTPACCLLLGKPFLSHNPTRGTSILGVDAHLGGFVLVNSTGSCIHPAESSALSITCHLCTHWNQHRHRQSSQGNNQLPRCRAVMHYWFFTSACKVGVPVCFSIVSMSETWWEWSCEGCAVCDGWLWALQAGDAGQRSLKGFFFAKLYFGIKEYELAQRHLSIYLHVRERDPKAHRFLGQIYEAQDNVEKACGCYERSVELNPMQKDLVLKIAELLSNHNITDERAKYWVEKAARLFPGNPAAYRLKEQLLERKGEAGWNQLLDMIRTELCARPDDLYLNIRLVALYRSNNKLRDAVLHCQEVEKKIPVDSSLEWCLCVIKTFEEYLESVRDLESDRNNWRAIKKDHLLAYSSLVKMTLASRDVQESRGALESFDRVLHSVKLCVNGPDELSRAFLEMKGHFYMHAGTFLLKMAQNSEAQWRDACELAALCYLKSFHIPKPKSKPVKGDGTGQDLLEMLACDRKSQSGHMLLNLSHSKEDFLKKIVENFANKRGLFTLFESLFGSGASKERSFLGTDDIGDVSTQAPVQEELSEYDIGAVRMHSGSLQHLVWLGLQWNSMSVLFPLRKLLERLFHLPQETSKLETDAPDSICLLDLEVFLLGMVFTGNLELQEKLNTRCGTHQPPFLPLLLCKQYCTEKQRSWWDAVCTLMQKKTIPDSVTKLRLLVQHGLSTLRALEKHGLQPALIMHWARSLQKTGISLNSFCDQKQYIGRSVYYWKKTLLSLKTIKKHKSIPEPTDPLFKHFRSVDIQVFQVAAYEEEAHIAFATLDAVEGKTDDALLAFEAIKNVVSYWNLAILCQRKAKEIENDAMLPEQREEHKTYLLKRKHYLMKVIDESSCDPSVANKLPVSVKTVTEMLNAVIQELGENEEEESLASGNISQAAGLEVKYSTPSPKRLSFSPANNYKFSPKTLPQWAEDQKSLLQMLSQQVEALKNEIQEMKRNRSGVSISSHGWPGESYGTDTVSAGYERAQNLHEVPVTVATSGPSVDYSRSPAYNSRHLLRTAATNVTPTKAPVCGMKGLAPQQHIYVSQQPIHTPPLQSTSAGVFPQDINVPSESDSRGSFTPTAFTTFSFRKGAILSSSFARASPCGKDAVAGLEGTGRVAADLSLGDAASDAAAEASELWSTSETPQKPVVSPAKFVFQAESVKSVFSSEKTFPFGNTSAPSSLFGFGVHPPRKSAASQKAEQEKPGAAEPPKSCGAPQKPLEGKASQLAPAAQDGPSNFSFKILEKVGSSVTHKLERECVTAWENKPSEEKAGGAAMQVPSSSVCGISSNVEDAGPTGSQKEVKTQRKKVRVKSLRKFRQ